MLRIPKHLQLKTLQKRRQVQGEGRPAILGDANGIITAPGIGMVWVREYAGQTETGLPRYSLPTPVREGFGVAYLKAPGRKVYVGRDASGQPAIIAGDFTDLTAIGITPAITNTLAPESRITNTADNFIPLRSDAVGNGNSPSTLVKVNQWLYAVGDGTLSYFAGTPLAADKVDLASYIPAAGYHCYAVVWLDTYTQLLSVTVSSDVALFTPLTTSDLADCFAARPADGVPIRAYYLADGATSVVQDYRHTDLRQMINTPPLWGFPQTLTTPERVRPNRTFLAPAEFATSGAGALTLESGARLTRVPHTNLSATTDPGVGDDANDGYRPGSIWVNTTADTIYWCVDATVGAAIWLFMGSFASFTVAGDSGTPQTISNGNTLTLAGGTGLSSVASATDTLTMNLDNTAVTPGSYTNTDLTVDAQGRITAAASGSSSGAPFADTTEIIKGSADATKRMRFEVDGLTTGTTRVATMPDADLTIVGTSTTQTLTNKTIDGDDNTVQDLPFSALKASVPDAYEILRRNGSGVVESTPINTVLADGVIEVGEDLLVGTVTPFSSAAPFFRASTVDSTTEPTVAINVPFGDSTGDTIFEIVSDDKAAIPAPVMPQTNRDAISPTLGQQVFNQSTGAPNYYGLNSRWYDVSNVTPSYNDKNWWAIRGAAASVLGIGCAVTASTVTASNQTTTTFVNFATGNVSGDASSFQTSTLNYVRTNYLPRWDIVLDIVDTTNIRLWCGLFSAAPNNADALTGTTHALAFRFSSTTDSGIVPVTHNGSAQTTGTAFAAIATGQVKLSIIVDGNANFLFNDDYSTMQTISATLPTSTQDLGCDMHIWTKTNAIKNIRFSRVMCRYN